MTKEEINVKTKEKVDAVNAFLKDLQLTATAESMVDKTSGIIRKVIYYMDNEAYTIDEPKNG